MNEQNVPLPEVVDPEPIGIRAPVWSHVLPFIAWLFVMQMLGDPAGWKYAVRTVLCLALFIYLKPWRWYRRLDPKNLPLALGVGVAVFFVWIFFETDFMAQWPAIQNAYLKYGTLWPWEMPDTEISRVYAPETCGWPLTITRILGSALVISVIEEFFWRGFVYRWTLKEKFLEADLGQWNVGMFWLVCLFFGLEHHRWFVGVLAGAAYGWMIIRTRDVWAASVAHGVTNLLLGIYVLTTGKFIFWS